MALPIGSGFYTGDIPARVSSTKTTTNKSANLLEQPSTQKTNTDYVKNSTEGQARAEALYQASSKNTEYSQTIYDQPNAQVSKAISTYTQFANLERRAEVQGLIGVDVYA
jgi:hypothetical protein